MPKTISPVLRTLALGAVLALSLAGCGRKGPLEPPPGAADVKPDILSQQNEDATAAKTLVPTIAPVGSGRKGKPITAPKDSFILDPIL